MALAFAFSPIQQKMSPCSERQSEVSGLSFSTRNAKAFQGTGYKIVCVFETVFHPTLVLEIV